MSFTVAHLSDWHTSSLEGAPLAPLLSKRMLGWLSWQWKRRYRHRPEILEALFRDLRGQAADHVAVTGDLTNIALEQEFAAAAGTLKALGEPDWVSLVPGNHDSYVSVSPERGWDLWAPYLCSDHRVPPGGGLEALPAAERAAARAPQPEAFPTLRVRGEIAFVGLCSALPTPWFFANGKLGEAQCARLRSLLRALGERGLCRIVMLHHPPDPATLSARRRLSDGGALLQVLEDAGAELVLHGHRHRTLRGSVPGPSAPIPVVGVCSSSELGSKPGKRARYHLYEIERSATGFEVAMRARGYDPESGEFVDEGSLPPA